MNSDWRAVAGTRLGGELEDLERVGGGDFAESFRATLADGQRVFVKTHRAPPPGFFTTEANGLDWLRAAGAARVPRVLAVDDDPPFLAIEWIDTARGGRGGDVEQEAAFGRELAALHAAGAAAFGREDRRTTGSLALPNVPMHEWAGFYADCRLRPLARIAHSRRVLDGADLDRLEFIASSLRDLGAVEESPARLHGDLWAGNRLVDVTGQSWLIDPAAHGGHREFDLAMMRLFGGFADACFDAYAEATPLTEGWRERVPLHQLAPLLVHAIKFGAGYLASVKKVLRRFG